MECLQYTRHSFTKRQNFGHDQIESINFADEILDVAKIMIPLFDSLENTVGKGENAVTIIFSFSHGVF